MDSQDWQRHIVTAALTALQKASNRPDIRLNQESTERPDTWLLRHCWRTLAAAGAVDEMFSVLAIVEQTEPQALFRALPLLAQKTAVPAVWRSHDSQHQWRAEHGEQSIGTHHPPPIPADRSIDEWAERLLAMACTSALTADTSSAFAYLERLDQSAGIWHLIFARADLRELLCSTVAHVGLHPLTAQLIHMALTHYGDTGAQFLKNVALLAADAIQAGRRTRANRCLLERCVTVFRAGTLTSIHSRRYAAATFARVGDVNAAMEQLSIIATVQEAHAKFAKGQKLQSAHTSHSSTLSMPRYLEDPLVRQVRRPNANADVDFQFYTLREILEQLPLDNSFWVQGLVQQVASLGARSDGWTASAAVTVLVRLGAIKQAAAVVDQLAHRDPTRSEAYRMLVTGLLAAGHAAEAQQYAGKALQWAQSLPERQPERVTIWGLADAYLAHGQPQEALALLARRRMPRGFIGLLQRFRRHEPNEETLRDEALRLRAALLLDTEDKQKAAAAHLSYIQRWARTLLTGKALAHFYTEHVLQPIAAAGQEPMLWSVLTEAGKALLDSLSGQELSSRVEDMMRVVMQHLHDSEDFDQDLQESKQDLSLHSFENPDPHSVQPQMAEQVYLDSESYALQFLQQLWQDAAHNGIWQTVYTIGGTLPLLLALAGPQAVVMLAQATAQHHWFVTSNE